MIQIRMLVNTLTDSHQKCIDGIRRYLTRHHLNWNFQFSDVDHVDTEPKDVWWIVFRDRHQTLIPDHNVNPITVLLGTEHSMHDGSVLDQAAFGRLAVHHLREQGYRSIAVIDGKDDIPANVLRREAIKDACLKHNILFHSYRHDHESLDSKLIDWLRDCPRHFAIYAYSDQQASWLRDLILNAGLHIPNDIALLGTGNQLKHCLRRDPQLSSIAIPWFALGEAAAHRVHRLIQQARSIQSFTIRPYEVHTRASSSQRTIVDSLVIKAQTWLQKNLASQKPLQEVADHCSCSIQTICSRFNSELHMSPKQLHDQYRCQHAQELLQHSRMNITDIARACGYRSSTAFGVSFKRRYGCTPTRFRMLTQ